MPPVAEVIEVSGVLKDISECGFTWRGCCEERDNEIMSDTSLLVIHQRPIKTTYHKLD